MLLVHHVGFAAEVLLELLHQADREYLVRCTADSELSCGCLNFKLNVTPRRAEESLLFSDTKLEFSIFKSKKRNERSFPTQMTHPGRLACGATLADPLDPPAL